MGIPITTPYSLELTKNESLKDAVVGPSSVVVPGKMKIFVGDKVNPAKRQSIVGSLRVCFRRIMEDKIRPAYADNIVAYSGALDAAAHNVTVSSSTSGITDGDVAVVVSSTFGKGNTHMADETFKQLIAAFLQNSIAN